MKILHRRWVARGRPYFSEVGLGLSKPGFNDLKIMLDISSYHRGGSKLLRDTDALSILHLVSIYVVVFGMHHSHSPATVRSGLSIKVALEHIRPHDAKYAKAGVTW